MSKFEKLSVAQDSYNSERISAVQRHARSVFDGYGANVKIKELFVSVDIKKTLTVSLFTDEGSSRTDMIVFRDVDLDGLIQHLQEAREFIREEESIAILRGPAPPIIY